MARRDRVLRDLRGPALVEPRKRILIVCEGQVTELQYFEGFKAWRRNPLVEVTFAGAAGDPMTLVRTAKQRRDDAAAQAERQNDDTLSFDEVWCCFDVDKFGPLVPAARNMALANQLHLAMSNPCFELWLILHLRDNPGAQEHHDMQRIFAGLQPGLHNKHINFDALASGYDEATRRAKRLHDEARAEGKPWRNPTTEVYLLTDSIDEAGRATRAQGENARQAANRAKAEAAAERAAALVAQQQQDEDP